MILILYVCVGVMLAGARDLKIVAMSSCLQGIGRPPGDYLAGEKSGVAQFRYKLIFRILH